MSKEMWIAAHERAIEEAMEADPTLTWEKAYASLACETRATELYRDRLADMADWAHEKMKDEGFSGVAAHKVGIPAQQKNDQGEKDGKEKGAGVAESGQQLFLTGRGECIHRARLLS